MSARWLCIAILSLFLAACGGGGGDGGPVNREGAASGQSSDPNGSSGDGSSDGDTASGGHSSGEGSSGSGGGNGGTDDANGGDGASGDTDGGTVSSPPAWEHDGTARFNRPGELVMDDAGTLFVTDIGNQAIRKIAATGEVSTVPGTYAQSAEIARSIDMPGSVYVLTYEAAEEILGGSSIIYRIEANGTRTEIKRFEGGIRTTTPTEIAIDGQGRLYVLNVGRGNDHVTRLDPDGSEHMVYHYFNYSQVVGMEVDQEGNIAIAFVGPEEDSTYIQWIPASVQPADASSAGITTQSLDLSPSAAIHGMRFGPQGHLYVATVEGSQPDLDTDQFTYGNFRMLRIMPNGEVSVMMDTFPDGSTHSRTASGWPRTFGVTLDASGYLYVSDPTAHAIYKIDSNGNSTLFAGTPGESGNFD